MILVVDDDSHSLEYTQYLLMTQGYDVITAKNGEEGVIKYKERSPDLVLMDIKMPIMDGYEAFLKIKEYDPDAKITFVTAFSIDTNCDRYKKCEDLGILGLLEKPCGPVNRP